MSLLLSSPWPSLLTSVQVFSNHLIQLSRPPQSNSLLLSRALPLPAQTSSSYLGSVSLWMSRFRFSLFDTTSLLLWNFSAFQQLFLMPFPCFQCSLAEQSDLWLVLSLFASLLAFRNHFMFQVHLDYALSPWHFFSPKEASLLLQWNQLVFLGLLSWSEPSSTHWGEDLNYGVSRQPSGIDPIASTSSGMLRNYYHGSANLRKLELLTPEQGCSLSPYENNEMHKTVNPEVQQIYVAFLP